MKEKYVVLFSGGQDSTTCLHYVLSKTSPEDVVCVFFDYGQRHATIEGDSAAKIADLLGVRLIKSELSLPVTSDLLDCAAEITPDNGRGLPSSFVPGRNLMLMTAAASIIYPDHFDWLVIGANAVDYSGYPDCRPQSLLAFNRAINAALGINFHVLAPLDGMGKDEIAKLGAMLGATESLSWSHTCYYGQFPPCGECPACIIRQKGFSDAGIVDPLTGEI